MSAALDQAIVAENARVIAALCPFCWGTGAYYDRRGERQICPNCKGSGDKADLPSRLR